MRHRGPRRLRSYGDSVGVDRARAGDATGDPGDDVVEAQRIDADALGRPTTSRTARAPTSAKATPASTTKDEWPKLGLDADGGVYSWSPSLLRRRTDWLAASEGLQDDHRCAAVRAEEARSRRFGLGNGARCLRSGIGLLQHLANAGQAGGSIAVGQKSVVANAMKATWQDVQKEAAHELVGVQGHRLVASAALGAVILPAECDASLVHGEKAAVRDGDAMGVARQIGQHRFGVGERANGRLA